MRRLAVTIAALVVAAACRGDVPDRGLDPLPEANVQGMEPTVQTAMTALRERLDGLARDRETDDATLGAAYGELGRHYQVHGMDEAAETCYRNAVKLMPDDFDSAYLLAIVLQEQGKLEEAVVAYDEARALREDFVPAELRVAQALLGLEDYSRARQHYEKALAHAEYAPAAHYGMGRLLAAQEEYEQAVAHFEAALAAQPQADRVHYPLGLAYRKLGRRDEAEEHLQAYGQRDVHFRDPIVAGLRGSLEGTGSRLKAGFVAAQQGRDDLAVKAHRETVAADPDDPEARQSLAGALLQTGDARGALEQYHEALRLNPDDPNSHYGIAFILNATERFSEAIPYLERALRVDPEFVNAHIEMARARLAMSDPESALESYAAALAIDPNNRAALLGRPAALKRMGRSEEAIAALFDLIEDDPGDAEAHVNLGVLLAEAGRVEEASATLGTALALDPEPRIRAIALYNMATIRLGGGDADGAIMALEEAIAVEPNLTDTRMLLAVTFGRMGRFVESAEQYGVVVGLNPDDLAARVGQATALVLSGDYAGARDGLENALERRPNEPQVIVALAKLLATCPEASVRDGRRALDLSLAAFEADAGLESAEAVAMAYAEIGDFEQAIVWQTRLVAEADRMGHPTLARLFRDNLARYERREPSRAPWNDR